MYHGKLLLSLVTLCWLSLFSAPGFAFPSASGCASCHPSFQGRGALHDMHVGNNQMTNNCLLCHTSVGDDPDINSSAEGVSCTGCHIPDGLWSHHQVSGISCAPCHVGWPTPAPEGTLPPYYSRTDVSLSDPCAVATAGGEDWDNDGKGLDNDGDDLYEAADPDCGNVSVEESTWSAIKRLYESE